jgi:hypothetical protein
VSATMAALSTIFEKIASKDKDYRYMATSDLLNELQKDTFHADAETERKICAVRPWGAFPHNHPPETLSVSLRLTARPCMADGWTRRAWPGAARAVVGAQGRAPEEGRAAF